MIFYTHLEKKFADIETASAISYEKAALMLKRLGKEIFETLESLYSLLKSSESSENRSLIFKIANLIIFEFFTDEANLIMESISDGRKVTTKIHILSEKVISEKGDREKLPVCIDAMNDCIANLVAYSENDSNPASLKENIEKEIVTMRNCTALLNRE